MRPARFISPAALCLIGGALLSVASSWVAEWAAPTSLANPPGGWATLAITPGAPWPFAPESLWIPKVAPPAGPTNASERPHSIGLTLRLLTAAGADDTYLVMEFRSGWPFRGMHRGLTEWTMLVWSRRPPLEVPPSRVAAGLDLLGKGPVIAPGDQRGPTRFPILPLWPGFALNTGFYACMLGLCTLGAAVARRALRRRRGLCERCAYPRTGGVCPECGWGAIPLPGQ